MQELLRRAIGLAKRRPRLAPAMFGLQVQQVEAACDALLNGSVTTHNGQRLRRRHLKHRDHLFT